MLFDSPVNDICSKVKIYDDLGRKTQHGCYSTISTSDLSDATFVAVLCLHIVGAKTFVDTT